jgi:hypothetical protein
VTGVFSGQYSFKSIEQEHQRVSGSIREYQGASGSIREPQRVSGSIREYQRVSGSIREYQRVSGSIRAWEGIGVLRRKDDSIQLVKFTFLEDHNKLPSSKCIKII